MSIDVCALWSPCTARTESVHCPSWTASTNPRLGQPRPEFFTLTTAKKHVQSHQGVAREGQGWRGQLSGRETWIFESAKTAHLALPARFVGAGAGHYSHLLASGESLVDLGRSAACAAQVYWQDWTVFAHPSAVQRLVIALISMHTKTVFKLPPCRSSSSWRSFRCQSMMPACKSWACFWRSLV